MRIHQETFYSLIQGVINQHDERIKTTISFIAPSNFFSRDMYADVMDIIKSIMHKREYIYEEYDYPKHLMDDILEVHNKIIFELCKYTYDRCSGYRNNESNNFTNVKTMFEISELKPLRLGRGVVDEFNYPPSKGKN